MQKSLRLARYILLGLLAALFAYWAFTTVSTGASLAAGALCCALYGGVLRRTVSGLEGMLTEGVQTFPDDELGPRSLRFARRHPWARIALGALFVRLALYIVAYAIYTQANGYEGGVLDTLRTMWLRTDSPSYLGIAERWYVTEGDPRFHIVFFPLYPLCIRAAWYIVRDYFAAAMLVSNVFAVASAIACYELTALELPRADALRSVKYMLLLPAAFFLGAPMGESLFLFLCLLTLYFARKRKFITACCLAALAGFARLPGVVLGVPIAMEMAAELCDRYRRKRTTFKKKLVLRLLCLLIVPLGLMGYLYINYRVTGNALTFMTYQREHWDQALSFFWNSPAYQTEYALGESGRTLWGLYIPNLAAQFGALLLLLLSAKDMRSSYSVYFLVYFALTMGATWLLSAPRYLTVLYPLILACTLRAREPQRDVLLTVLCAAGLIAYMSFYVLGYPVY